MTDSVPVTQALSQQRILNVLLVDDSDSFSERLQELVMEQLQILHTKNDVVTMSRFNDANRAIKLGHSGQRWDLLITDVYLKDSPPVQDKLGFELVEAAQKLSIPSIALSSSPNVTSEDISKYYIRFGPNRFRYIHKNQFRELLPEALSDIVSHGHWISAGERIEASTGESAMATDPNLIAALKEMKHVNLKDCTVVGDYRRYEESSRNDLIHWRNTIIGALELSSNAHENFLIWATPGGGKTYFVEQIAAELGDKIKFVSIDVSKHPVSALEALSALDPTKPVLCLLDEIDSPNPTIRFETIRSYLDMNLKSTNNIVFALVGSKPNGGDELLERIRRIDKGSDVLRRVLEAHRIDIPAPSIQDTVVILLSQAAKTSHEVSLKLQAKGEPPYRIMRVQKAAIFYVLMTKAYHNPGQLCDLINKAVRRAGRKSDLQFDDLFQPNSLERYEFASPHVAAMKQFWNTYIIIDE